MSDSIDFHPVWKKMCNHYYDRVLIGNFSHWCRSLDNMPIDETVDLWIECKCFSDKEKEQGFPDPLPIPK